MSSAGEPNVSNDIKELTSKIQQFLSHQVESNKDLSDAARESLVVAFECIEQAYGISREPASNDLLNIYKASKSNKQQSTGSNPSNQSHSHQGNPNTSSQNNENQRFQSQQPQQQQQPQLPVDATQFITNLASSIFSQVGGFAAAGAAPGQPQQASTQAESANTTPTPTTSPESQQPSAPPMTRKRPTEAEAIAAESFKNQGNDCMKQDKFREAYDYYTQAIEIDNSNAIYYANRAAASSKLGNHQAAVEDCQISIDMDPNYSKAYGRLGLAYASLNNHQKAKEAYKKAVELDPSNESYKNNLSIAEEKLAEARNSGGGLGAAAGASAGAGASFPLGGAAMGPPMMNMLRSMMNNPDVMSMAMRSLQDPRIQSMFGLGGGGAQGGGPAGGPTGGAPR